MENLKLGNCCACERENETVRNAVMLDKKIPSEKGGWGCFVCGLEPHGAVAVLCDECLDKYAAQKLEIKFACLGYPGENRRIEIEKLKEDFAHDLTKHSGENQDFIECRNCEKIVAVVDGTCSNCGEEICIVCGCTDSAACLEGCEWSRPNVCSSCA